MLPLRVMPITQLLPSRWALALAACAALAAGEILAAGVPQPPAVAVVRSAPWSPGDTAREGAEEFSVLMSLAQVQRGHALAGLVGVSGTHGVFQPGAERALRFAVFSGVPVVKIAARGDLAACPDEVFIEAGALSETEACRILAVVLARLGPAPRAVNPARPTESEFAAVRAHVRRLQEEFAIARGTQIARN